MFLEIFFWSTVGTSAPGCLLSGKKCVFEYKYYQKGDIIIGGVFTVNTDLRELVNRDGTPGPELMLCTYIDLTQYKNLLAFTFAVDEINRDPDLLPDITLGYHAYDSCGSAQKAIKDVIQILSGTEWEIPNYSCPGRGNIAGFIGDRQSLTTLPMAQILSVYGYPQISYGTSDPQLSDRVSYPYFFRTLQDEQTRYEGILIFLEHFDWNWVGIITSGDERGERELSELSRVITRSGICIEFIITMSDFFANDLKDFAIIKKARSQVVPKARCNDYCPPGSRKAPGRGYRTCCYRCVPCSEGEVSNKIDSDICQKCPDNECPDQKKIKCVPKNYEFLSYKEDIMALVFSVLSVTFSLMTIFVLGIFIYFRDTPIVRANNRNLSFILLVSLMLSFLCVFLFVGRPVDITCRLRQTAFGVLFSLAVSTLLAKTIMVCIAFKATKPGSFWRKWFGIKVSNSVVLICSFVQILINSIWLSISPPFNELDMHTSPVKIIVQCNEGSVIAFYCVLGYMGLLAAVSFIIAFLARTLPDSFNEAKYITFSMLVFCSVWIAMIPAYLSTKGKNMVAVEIFAILASSAGILGCIFFPKCYILLMKPEMNTKTHLLEIKSKHTVNLTFLVKGSQP
ncbi:vomeronasal type-2 receptor 26-like [Spea bombifrons]|uniref:vomeronasal type-2 receptor 26-like n=1 Tax=Spea bombifrons TaxID=233779 RepID=UPI00234AE6BB|nr:vomeronasal type-2 receptor 26-like [Spea bombifrons]